MQAGERDMLKRLKDSIKTDQDLEFHLHELKESTLRGTLSQEEAHAEALRWRNVTERYLFHIDVICANPEVFNSTWLE